MVISVSLDTFMKVGVYSDELEEGLTEPAKYKKLSMKKSLVTPCWLLLSVDLSSLAS